MSIDKIISEIEEQSSMVNIDPLFEDNINFTNEVIDIIRKHTEGMVLVPGGWAKAAKCPNNLCKDGVIPHQVAEFEWEPEQCQFCYEKEAMLQASKEGE